MSGCWEEMLCMLLSQTLTIVFFLKIVTQGQICVWWNYVWTNFMRKLQWVDNYHRCGKTNKKYLSLSPSFTSQPALRCLSCRLNVIIAVITTSCIYARSINSLLASLLFALMKAYTFIWLKRRCHFYKIYNSWLSEGLYYVISKPILNKPISVIELSRCARWGHFVIYRFVTVGLWRNFFLLTGTKRLWEYCNWLFHVHWMFSSEMKWRR